MSQALQRMVVRLMVDPKWRREVFEGALTPELDEDERRLLMACDPRAFGVDPYQRARLLSALMEEFPVGTAMVADGGRALHHADAFLSSADFHVGVQERQRIALIYGAWLANRIGGVGRIELALAQSRRDRRDPGVGISRGRGWVPLRAQAESIYRFAALRERLGANPVQALADGVSLWGLPVPGKGEEFLLVEPGPAGEGSVGEVTEGLLMLLTATTVARPRAEVRDVALAAGAEEHEVDDLLAELLGEGLLVEVLPD
jgi:hypothetical protein